MLLLKFIYKDIQRFQSDNGGEFVKKILDAYLISINVRHFLGLPYHPQNQGAIRLLIKLYRNIFQLHMIMQNIRT